MQARDDAAVAAERAQRAAVVEAGELQAELRRLRDELQEARREAEEAQATSEARAAELETAQKDMTAVAATLAALRAGGADEQQATPRVRAWRQVAHGHCPCTVRSCQSLGGS